MLSVLIDDLHPYIRIDPVGLGIPEQLLRIERIAGTRSDHMPARHPQVALLVIDGLVGTERRLDHLRGILKGLHENPIGIFRIGFGRQAVLLHQRRGKMVGLQTVFAHGHAEVLTLHGNQGFRIDISARLLLFARQ